jgi:hypothetical protein
MPFRDIANISLDERQRLTAVFDEVCARLNIASDDPRRANIAAKIMALAATGERDRGKLIEQTLQGLA